MKQNVYFVSGIDTDAGKSYATGFLAREWNKNGQRTITQKFIQTGNVGHSEDIDLHRHIMGIPFTEEDKEGLTMPEIFSYPASPHLASQLDNRPLTGGPPLSFLREGQRACCIRIRLLFRLRSRERLPRRNSKLGDSISEKLTLICVTSLEKSLFSLEIILFLSSS